MIVKPIVMKQMKYWLLAGVMAVTACNTSIGQKKNLVDAPAFAKMVEGADSAGINLVDVRTPEEYQSGHMRHAMNINWNSVYFADHASSLDKNKPTYVYCLAGGRSADAAKWMRKNGFKNVIELDGGMNAWRRNQLPLVYDLEYAQLSPDALMEMVQHAGAPLVLVDFGATWCPPCKKMKPVLESLETEMEGAMKLVKVDGGENLKLLEVYHLQELPSYILFRDGKEVWRATGLQSKDSLRTVFNQYR